jgi:anti-sigma-K factor RskA
MQPPQLTEEITDLVVAYALNALEPEEMERVGALLAQRPDLRALLAELQATASLLPYGLPEATPPSELRRRVLDHAVGRAPAMARQDPGPAALGQRLRGWLYGLGGLAAAALVALLVTLGQLSGARAELAQTRELLAQAEQQVAAVNDERSQFAEALAAASALSRLEGPGGQAAVLQASDGEVLFAAQLPQLAEGQVYQLWTIAGQGSAPVSAGVFRVDDAGYGVLALGPGAAASGITLAVTAEPGPAGSPGPTTDVLVAGQLT